MIEDPRLLVPPVIAAQESPAPTPEISAVDGTEVPPPTAEQTQAADKVFANPVQANPVATMFGVLTSAMLLRDVAVDTFDTSEDDEPEPQGSDEDKDPDPEED
jgi:hypothetical protein